MKDNGWVREGHFNRQVWPWHLLPVSHGFGPGLVPPVQGRRVGNYPPGISGPHLYHSPSSTCITPSSTCITPSSICITPPSSTCITPLSNIHLYHTPIHLYHTLIHLYPPVSHPHPHVSRAHPPLLKTTGVADLTVQKAGGNTSGTFMGHCIKFRLMLSLT